MIYWKWIRINARIINDIFIIAILISFAMWYVCVFFGLFLLQRKYAAVSYKKGALSINLCEYFCHIGQHLGI